MNKCTNILPCIVWLLKCQGNLFLAFSLRARLACLINFQVPFLYLVRGALLASIALLTEETTNETDALIALSFLGIWIASLWAWELFWSQCINCISLILNIKKKFCRLSALAYYLSLIELHCSNSVTVNCVSLLCQFDIKLKC